MGKKGMGTLIKGGNGNWLVKVILNGKATTRSTGTKNKKEAIAFQKKLAEKKLADSDRTIEENIRYHREMLNYYLSLQHKKEVSLEKLFDEFSNKPEVMNITEGTLAVYKTSISGFVKFIKDKYPKVKNARELTETMISDWIAFLKSKLSTNTVSLRVTMINHVLKVILGDTPLCKNKISKTKPIIERKSFTPEEMRRIFDCAKKHSKEIEILFYIAAFTGARRCDSCRMKWSNIDFETGRIHYIPEKTKKRGTVVDIPIHPQLLEVLKSIPKGNDDDYITPNLAKKCKGRSVTLAINKVLKNAGVKIDGEGLHSFRRNFCSQLANNGVNQFVVQQSMGHSSLLQTSEYFKMNADQIREQFDKSLTV